jgi:cell division protease FtsH
VHSRKVPLDESIDLAVLARGTPGFSGADLANLVNEAALFSARGNRRVVTMEEFEKARDKIMMGAERRSMVMSEKEKINTAYHEAGHAIIGRLVPEHDPVHKVTIIPRGRALGVTQYLPEEDRYSMSRTQLFSQLCSLFGGRIAEEIIGGFDAVTTGASNDIERATQMARNMVTKWGLNEKMGPILYGEDESQAPGGGNTHYSEDTSREIDQEVKTILNDAYARATNLLTENRDILEAMKDALMEYETIDADQVDDLMNRRKVREPRHWDKNDFDSSGGGASKADKDADKESPIGGTVEDV